MIDASNVTRSKVVAARALFILVLAEFIIFLFSGVGFHSLYKAPFFSFGVDFFYGVFYYFHIPQFIVSNLWLGYFLDALIVLLLIWVILRPLTKYLAVLLFILLFTYYITLTGYHTHSNYQVGFVLILFPFLFHNEKSRAIAFECLRYYLLFFYISAAYLKLSGGSLWNVNHFSNAISGQFAPYFLEGDTGLRTRLNLYLIKHASVSFWLYFLGFLAELSALIAFFTKKYDKLLCLVLLLFHFINWFIMDIAPFGHISFICLLLFSYNFSLKNPDLSYPKTYSASL